MIRITEGFPGKGMSREADRFLSHRLEQSKQRGFLRCFDCGDRYPRGAVGLPFAMNVSPRGAGKIKCSHPYRLTPFQAQTVLNALPSFSFAAFMREFMRENIMASVEYYRERRERIDRYKSLSANLQELKKRPALSS